MGLIVRDKCKRLVKNQASKEDQCTSQLAHKKLTRKCPLKRPYVKHMTRSWIVMPAYHFASTSRERTSHEVPAIDTVFCPPLICILDPENSKNIIFSLWGHEYMYNGMTHPVQTSEHSKCLFSAKITKMPLVNLGLTEGQNPHKTTFFMVLYQTRAPRRFLATLTKFDLELTPSRP